MSEVIQLSPNVEYALSAKGGAIKLNKNQSTSFSDLLASIQDGNQGAKIGQLKNASLNQLSNLMESSDIFGAENLSLEQLISESQDVEGILNEIISLLTSTVNDLNVEMNENVQQKINELISQGNNLINNSNFGSNNNKAQISDFISEVENTLLDIKSDLNLKEVMTLLENNLNKKLEISHSNDNLSLKDKLYEMIRKVDQKNYSKNEVEAKVSLKQEQENIIIEPIQNNSKSQKQGQFNMSSDQSQYQSYDFNMMTTNEGLSAMNRLESQFELNQMTVPMIKNMDEILELFNKESLKVENLEKSMLEVQLHPRELGQMKIKLEMVQGLLSGKIIVDNANAKAAITQNLEQIVDQIADQGVSIGSLDVDIGGQFNQHEGNGQMIDDELNVGKSSQQNQEDYTMVHQAAQSINIYERMRGTTFSTLA